MAIATQKTFEGLKYNLDGRDRLAAFVGVNDESSHTR